MSQIFVDKIIFLDFDGVINHENWYEWIHEHKEFLKEGGHDSIDPKSVEKVLSICKETGAYIVISSSWRYNTLDHTITKLSSIRDLRTLLERVVGVTPPSRDRMRGLEIKYFLNACRKHNFILPNNVMLSNGKYEFSQEPKYVIFDDDDDMLVEQWNNFIHVNDRTGISDEDVNKAIKILND